MNYNFFKILSVFFTFVRWLFLFNALIILIGMSEPYMGDASRFAYMRSLTAVDKQMNAVVRETIPTEFNGKDYSHIIRLVLSLIIASVAANYAYEFHYRSRMVNLKKEAADFKNLTAVQGENPAKLSVLDEKLHKIETASRSEREGLMKEFVAIKKKLESMGRNLAFLAVDVVDSTGMKASEDPIVITHDFTEYRKFVESKLNAYGCLKSAWTPDGLMACFNTVEEAVKTGQSLINGLVEFNQSVKAMKRDFVVRCGINAGYLLFDESLPLEQISDRVIDIAGHMQKYAAPNTIYIAKTVIQPISQPEHFQPADKTVDDIEVYTWEGKEADKN